MRLIDKYYNQNDELLHPLWLGILLLVSVMIIIGIICCFRIKYGLQLRHLCNRLFENSSSDDKYPTINYSHNWPPIYICIKTESPKLYKLVKSIQTAKQLSLEQQSINEDDNGIEINTTVESHHLPRISITPSIDSTKKAEIARKFYASMRNTSEFGNSVDSYNNDTSLPSNNLLSTECNEERNITLFRTSSFFQSVPNQDRLVITL